MAQTTAAAASRPRSRDPKRDSAPDLVDRDFARAEPNRLWVCDLKYVQTGQGFLFLAAVQDVFSRRIIGWSMRDDLKAELVLDALGMAVTAEVEQMAAGLEPQLREDAFEPVARHERERLHAGRERPQELVEQRIRARRLRDAREHLVEGLGRPDGRLLALCDRSESLAGSRTPAPAWYRSPWKQALSSAVGRPAANPQRIQNRCEWWNRRRPAPEPGE